MRTSPPDAYGRVTVDMEAAFGALYDGVDIAALAFEPSPDVDAFNGRCESLDMGDHALLTHSDPPHSPEEEHARRAAAWLLGDALGDIDMRALLLDLCETPEARARIEEEMVLFEERGLMPLLRAMVALVMSLRERGVVWGVGRGSSVASYALYLIGLHRIDALRHNLDIREFLKG